MAKEAMVVHFWGVRGTLPVPGEKTTRYGGNTNCVSLRIAPQHFFIFDAGTGLKELSNELLRQNQFPLSAKLFISHPHYDHISAFPFFAPFFIPENEFEILGTHQGDKDIKAQIVGQMGCVYLPFTAKEFTAKLSYRSLDEGDFTVDDIHVQALLLKHPGRCLGYRVEHQKKSFCYITDNELLLESSPDYDSQEVERLIDFIKATDVLVIDATYTDEEYLRKIGWGHSCISRVVDVADRAKVKLLCLYHHDPDQFDQDIDDKLKTAQALLEAKHSITRCIAPREGEELVI